MLRERLDELVAMQQISPDDAQLLRADFPSAPLPVREVLRGYALREIGALLERYSSAIDEGESLANVKRIAV